MTAQARACDWPALVPAERLNARELDRWWQWCLSSGQEAARQRRELFRGEPPADGTDRLVDALYAEPSG